MYILLRWKFAPSARQPSLAGSAAYDIAVMTWRFGDLATIAGKLELLGHWAIGDPL